MLESPMDGLRHGTDLHFASLYKIITNSPAPDLFLTTYGDPIPFEGDLYTPAIAMSATATREELGMRSVDFDIDGGLSSDLITEEDLRNGAYRNAEITHYVVDPRYPWAGHFKKEHRDIRTVSYTGEVFSATVTGISNRLNQQRGYKMTRPCRDFVGGPKCRFDLEPMRFHGVRVAEVIDNVNFKCDISTLSLIDNGHFERGLAKWTSGANRSSQTYIREHLGPARLISLMVEPMHPVQVGDLLTLEPGCDGLRSTCATKFDWLRHHQGMPFLPGPKRTFNTPRSL